MFFSQNETTKTTVCIRRTRDSNNEVHAALCISLRQSPVELFPIYKSLKNAFIELTRPCQRGAIDLHFVSFPSSSPSRRDDDHTVLNFISDLHISSTPRRFATLSSPRHDDEIIRLVGCLQNNFAGALSVLYYIICVPQRIYIHTLKQSAVAFRPSLFATFL